MQPIDTINDPGFRAMIKTFEPRYTPPDRKTPAVKYVPQMHYIEKKRVSNLISSVQHYSCTTEIWTSRAQHAYVSLTIHYIAADFTLQEFPESHSGVNIAHEIT